MKTIQFYLLASVILLSAACSKQQKAPPPPIQKHSANQVKDPAITNDINKTLAEIHRLKKLEASTPVSENFTSLDPSNLPISNKHLGDFPYFSAPDGYYYDTSKQRKEGTKYFFSQHGKLISISGRYFFANLVARKGSTTKPEEVLLAYEKSIINAGGVKIFAGPAPDALAREYSKNAPPKYWGDMYSPLAEQYAQYLINNSDKDIWIEIAFNSDASRIDLSVVQRQKNDSKNN